MSIENAIREAAVEAKRAAERRVNEPDHRRLKIGHLLGRLDRDAELLEAAIMSNNLDRVRECTGNVVHTAVQIADHACALGEWESAEEEVT